MWNQFNSRSKDLKSTAIKAESVHHIRTSSQAGFCKWSRYKQHAQRQVLFNVKKHLYISRRAQLPSTQISRNPPVTLEDYVNQTKLMELLQYELPEAEELGITQIQHRYLRRLQFKVSLDKLYQTFDNDSQHDLHSLDDDQILEEEDEEGKMLSRYQSCIFILTSSNSSIECMVLVPTFATHGKMSSPLLGIRSQIIKATFPLVDELL